MVLRSNFSTGTRFPSSLRKKITFTGQSFCLRSYLSFYDILTPAFWIEKEEKTDSQEGVTSHLAMEYRISSLNSFHVL